MHAGQAEAPYGLAGVDVFLLEALGFGDEAGKQIVAAEGGVGLPERFHAVHGPGQVDGRGTGLAYGLHLLRQDIPPVLAPDLGKGHGAAKGRGNADGGRAAHDHGLQGVDDVVCGSAEEALLHARQLALVEQVEDGVLFVEADMVFHVSSGRRAVQEGFLDGGTIPESPAGRN